MPLDAKQRLLLDIKDPFKRNTFLDTVSTYSKTTLVGDWFNARALAEVNDQNRVGIVPGCVEGQKCVKAQTVTQVDFTPPKVNKRTLTADSEYGELRTIAFMNGQNNRRGNISLFDKEEFLRNLTTTTDLFYRLKPQRVVQTDDAVPRKLVEEDYLQSYGNQTNFRLREYMRCKAIRERRERKGLTTTYRDQFRTPQKYA